MNLKPIGVIHTPFKTREEVELCDSRKAKGTVEIYPEFAEGLLDLEGFERIILIFCFHQSKGYELLIRPRPDPEHLHGVFSTRSPRRPNPIGLTAVKLLKRENNILYVKGVDMLEGTPLLDIKPYIPRADSFKTARNGWLASREA